MRGVFFFFFFLGGGEGICLYVTMIDIRASHEVHICKPCRSFSGWLARGLFILSSPGSKKRFIS